MSKNNPKDIALLGGTFDPIHLGHIKPAKQVINWLNVNELILLPAHIPPHKAQPTTSSSVRAEMVDLVCQQHNEFTCDKRELNRNKPSFTVDTLREIKHEHPHSRLFFLIGMDSLLNFTQWHQWQTILTLCHLVVITRPGYEKTQLTVDTQALLERHQSTLANIGTLNSGKILFAPSSEYDISSTQIREYIAEKKPIEKYVSPEVATYIFEHQLYLP